MTFVLVKEQATWAPVNTTGAAVTLIPNFPHGLAVPTAVLSGV